MTLQYPGGWPSFKCRQRPSSRCRLTKEAGGTLRAHLLCKRSRNELIERDPIPPCLLLSCRLQ